MKQVSTLFDALRNEKFAIAVKDDYGVKYYGSDGQGREWADWANSINQKSLESNQLPAGIVQGPYKNISDSSLKSLLTAFGNNISEMPAAFGTSRGYSYKSSYRYDNGARVPAVMDTPIGHFTVGQYSSAVNYKALTLRTQIKESSFLFEARANNYAFNFENWMYNAMPSKAEIKSLRGRIDNNLGRSTERRLGMKMKASLIERDGRYRVGLAGSLETKSLESSLEEKGIGQRIGGAGRLGRRAYRGAAMFDPKAWDGDGDGVVQEGTPFERPAIPGVNDRSTGGAVDADAATRAWRDYKKTNAGKRIDTRDRGTRIPSGGPIQPPADAPKRTPRKGDGKRVSNVKPTTRRTSETRIPRGGAIQPPEGAPTRPRSQGMRSRIGAAQMDRQATGLASRSGRAKQKSKLKATPGKDRVDERDGSLWNSLTPEQQAVVKKNAQTAYEELQKQIKTDKILGTWWRSFRWLDRKPNATDADGKPWDDDSRIAGEAFTSFEGAIGRLLKSENETLDAMKADLARMQASPSQFGGPAEQKKLENRIKAKERAIENVQKVLDDLRTYNQMYQSDDWSLLEHLHPGERRKAFGVNKKNDSTYESPFPDGKRPKDMKIDEPSTIFEEVGGIKRAKPKLIGERGDKFLADFAERVLRPNPERAERRRLRKMKKAGRGGFNVEQEGRGKEKGKVKKRINKARRSIKRKFTKTREPSKIDKKIAEGRTVRIFERDADGKVVIGDETIDLIAEIANETAGAGRGEFKGQRDANLLLGFLWENNGFNREATLVTEDEAIALLDAGWYPIKRGVGSEEFAEDWLRNPRRRISGQGGQAEGPGEYWSLSDSTMWNSPSYWGSSNQNGGILAFLPPDYKVASAQDRTRMALEYGKIAQAFSNVVSIMPKGEAEKMEPADFVRELRAALAKVGVADGDPIWNDEVGQMWSALISAYESADGAEKAKLWNVIDFLGNKLTRQNQWENYVPLILGYDAIDTGPNSARTGGTNDGKQFLVFNRQGLAAFEEPVNVARVNEILGKADQR